MRNFIAFFIKNPIWTNAIILLVTFFGLAAMMLMRHSFMPELEPTKIFVTVAYSGASPEEMEEGVTSRVEEALEGIAGIEEITSSSRENIASITIEAYEGTDLNELLQDVKNAVDGISSFPAGAEKPVVIKQKTSGMSLVGFVSIQGPDDLWKMKEISEKIEKDFLNSPDISDVSINGYPPLEMVIEVKEENLQRYNLRMDELVNAIRLNNNNISGGIVKTDEEQLFIRAMSKTTNPKEIERFVVRTQPDGQKITMGDVANVKLDFSETPSKSYVDGQRSVVLFVNKLPNEDLDAISDFIKDYIAKFNTENSEYKMQPLFMFDDLLDDRINMLVENGIFGMFLVLFALSLFLKIRLSLWVAFGIPFSFLGMFLIGYLYGMTINLISLFGMIVVVGILVDDAIVIAENIYSHFERGKSPYKAAVDGTMEVLPSVFTSVLTTIVAFSILFFVGKDLKIMTEMAFAVVVCLSFSLLEAFLILPSHLASEKVLRENKNPKQRAFRAKLEKGIDKIRDGYAKMLSHILKHYKKYVWAPLGFILIIGILWATNVIKSAFFPSIPFDAIKIEAAYQPGETEEKTEAFLWYCDSIVNEIRQEIYEEFNDSIITYVSLNVGFTEGLGEGGPHAGMLRLSIKETDKISANEIANRIRERLDKEKIKELEKFTVGDQERFGRPVSISLRGENTKDIKEAKDFLKDKLKELKDIKDVTDNSGVGNRELHIQLKEKAKLLGLTHADVLNQIRQGFFGAEAQRVIIGRDEVRIWVRYPKEDRKTLGQLEQMKIRTLTGEEYPLQELVTYSIERGIVGINHINGEQEISVYADLFDSELAAEVNKKIQENIVPELEENFPDVEAKFLGQAESANESYIQLTIAMIGSVMLILIILSLNFNSFYQARMIMMVLPVGFMSAVLGHGLEGKPFSVLSMWGIIALLGILVNDAVVMIDTLNRNIKNGMNLKDAVFDAGKSRFRPIVLTSLTTVVGLYPLIMEQSFQAQWLIPMAISVAYGVFFGTIVILFFLPPLILYFNDIRRERWQIWRWLSFKENTSTPEQLEVEPAYRSMLKEKQIDIENEN
ncbi:MAG: efflux RND transporter permease subunit [Bacteroidia bacterium]